MKTIELTFKTKDTTIVYSEEKDKIVIKTTIMEGNESTVELTEKEAESLLDFLNSWIIVGEEVND